MPEVLLDPVSRLIHLHSNTDRRIIIALAGYPGSGKSTIAKLWAQEIKGRTGAKRGKSRAAWASSKCACDQPPTVNKKIRGDTFIILGMDGFHLSRARLRAMDDPDAAFARRGAPYTFDPAGLIDKMTELRDAAGKSPVGWPGFEHEVGDPVDDAVIIPADCRLILVEGIYILLREGEWAGLEGLFDETWFLDTSVETSMSRIHKRHMEAWGMSIEEARQRADSNDRLNCAHITPGRENADYLVGG